VSPRLRISATSLLLATLLAAFACPASATVDSWRGRGPAPGGWGPSAVYDPIRQRMVIFGGLRAGEVVANSDAQVWELSLTGTPSWTALTDMGNYYGSGPAGRQAHAAIYDPVRDRMIVFGGRGGNVYNDVWAFPLSGPPVWTQLFPSGTAPVAREGVTGIYDPVRDRMLVFGGNDAAHVDHNDVWALSLGASPAWTKLTPTGTPPAPRGWHSAIYDPVRDRMVIFAGYVWATDGWLADAWSLNLAGTPAWSAIAASGAPGARNSHSAIYDPVGDRMIVYGGYNDPAHPADLTVLSFGGSPAWSVLTPAGTPPAARDGQAMIYDATSQRVVIYGGVDEAIGNVWAATLAGSPAWSAIAPVGVPTKSAYGRGPVVYDSLRDRMLFLYLGGAEVWASPLGGEPAWTKLATTGTPTLGDRNSAIYDAAHDRIVIFGGYWTTETWVLPLSTLAWSPLGTTGDDPGYHAGHTAIYDAPRDRMVVFGGGDGGSLLDQVWVLSFANAAWGQLTPAGTPPPGRSGHTAIYDATRDRMVICGGFDGVSPFREDVWALTLASPAWSELVPAVQLPGTRTSMSAVYDAPRDRMLMFGGNDGVTGDTNDLWVLDFSGTPAWTQLSPAGVLPPARQEHGALYDPVRDRMIVYGGNNGVLGFRDIWELSPASLAAVPESPGGGSRLALAPPRPNPSREDSAIRFAVPVETRVTLDVFDVCGRRVRRLLDAALPAGAHDVTWRGDDERGRAVDAGLYFVRLRCGADVATQRVLRLR
jgi:hypothetical protein